MVLFGRQHGRGFPGKFARRPASPTPGLLVTYLGMAVALAAVAFVGRILILAALACALAGVFGGGGAALALTWWKQCSE
jgi:hypothetical protein